MRRALLLLSLIALPLSARVISYAPYTDRAAVPAFQSRTNRHFALVETTDAGQGFYYVARLIGEVVVYDTTGVEEPRVVFPPGGGSVPIHVAAVREEEGELDLIVQAEVTANRPAWFLSVDGGHTWKTLDLPDANPAYPTSTALFETSPDSGGPFARSSYSAARAGTHQTPFVVSAGEEATAGIYSVERNGTTRKLIPSAENLRLIGENLQHDRFLVSTDGVLKAVDLAGNITLFGTMPVKPVNGWLSPDGSAYVIETSNGVNRGLSRYVNGQRGVINGGLFDTGFVAVPTAGYDGAWVSDRSSGLTYMNLFTPGKGLVNQWVDFSGPEIEALHAGASGNTLLIQVHRQRNVGDQFIDPALAVWHIDRPPPPVYDELYTNEQPSKGFVHVDPDTLESGAPFVFDSGIRFSGCIVCSPPAPVSGADVIQEWGVVRGSLTQKLVLPGISRTRGANGSDWRTDVTFHNPFFFPQKVHVRYVPTGDGPQSADVKETTLTLEGMEIRLVPDALGTLFGIESGGGAFFITPEPGNAINAVSRTYTQSALGTYGFGMNAIDHYAAVGPRFGLSFSGAFPGAGQRTNIILTDVSGRGASARPQAATSSGFVMNVVPPTPLFAPPLGQQQTNLLQNRVGLGDGTSGALALQPLSGEVIASVFVIDNLTNDPTWFPPDIPTTTVRTIPAVGHVDGANGARFRTDLYLYNASDQSAYLNLQVSSWTGDTPPSSRSYTLKPHEARVLPDILLSEFSRIGFARLRVQSDSFTGDSTSVRVSARTYTVDDAGGTYGFLMPPLNSFQTAGPGDSLEILGATTDPSMRTNVGIVDLVPIAGIRTAHAVITIVDKRGTTIDEQSVAIPPAGGLQLNDIFHARNIPASTGPVIIRVTSPDGSLGAYAASVDNGTNDPTYLPAQLRGKG